MHTFSDFPHIMENVDICDIQAKSLILLMKWKMILLRVFFLFQGEVMKCCVH